MYLYMLMTVSHLLMIYHLAPIHKPDLQLKEATDDLQVLTRASLPSVRCKSPTYRVHPARDRQDLRGLGHARPQNITRIGSRIGAD